MGQVPSSASSPLETIAPYLYFLQEPGSVTALLYAGIDSVKIRISLGLLLTSLVMYWRGRRKDRYAAVYSEPFEFMIGSTTCNLVSYVGEYLKMKERPWRKKNNLESKAIGGVCGPSSTISLTLKKKNLSATSSFFLQ